MKTFLKKTNSSKKTSQIHKASSLVANDQRVSLTGKDTIPTRLNFCTKNAISAANFQHQFIRLCFPRSNPVAYCTVQLSFPAHSHSLQPKWITKSMKNYAQQMSYSQNFATNGTWNGIHIVSTSNLGDKWMELPPRTHTLRIKDVDEAHQFYSPMPTFGHDEMCWNQVNC